MKAYFNAYHDMRIPLGKLPEASVGRLFLALLYYSEKGEDDPSIKLRTREKCMYDVYTQMIDRDRERYDRL